MMAATPSLPEMEALIARERAAMHALFEERVLPLLVRRRILAGARPEARVPKPAAPAAPATLIPAPVTMAARPAAPPMMPGRDAPLSVFLRRGRGWSSARIVMAALEEGPEEGLRGRDLNALLLGWGHALDTAESTKTRLGHLGAVRFDVSSGRWSLTEAYRASIPEGARIVPDAQDRGRAKGPAEQTGGRIILDALAAGPAAGMTREDLVQAVVGAGFSRSLGRHAHGALDMAGVIVRGERPDTWKLSPAGVGGRRMGHA